MTMECVIEFLSPHRTLVGGDGRRTKNLWQGWWECVRAFSLCACSSLFFRRHHHDAYPCERGLKKVEPSVQQRLMSASVCLRLCVPLSSSCLPLWARTGEGQTGYKAEIDEREKHNTPHYQQPEKKQKEKEKRRKKKKRWEKWEREEWWEIKRECKTKRLIRVARNKAFHLSRENEEE